MGFVERFLSNIYLRRFVFFCRVGIGFFDEEFDELVIKLKFYLRKYEYLKKLVLSFY